MKNSTGNTSTTPNLIQSVESMGWNDDWDGIINIIKNNYKKCDSSSWRKNDPTSTSTVRTINPTIKKIIKIMTSDDRLAPHNSCGKVIARRPKH